MLGPAHQDIADRWTSEVVLKRDVFSTVERGRFRTEHGEVDAVLRRIDGVPWWSWPVARHLFARERRALSAAPPGIAPALLHAESKLLVRSWIDGVALHIAKPHGDTAYFLSAKAALRALTKTIALEVGPLGIRCNCLVPGSIETDLWVNYGHRMAAEQGITYEQWREKALAGVPLRTISQPIDIANLALFLASDEGRYINCHDLVVDGGMTAGGRVNFE